ncbi:MFS transporter [Telmatospirillum siberiense]|uniref:MFS transporter n=1 Tax=Telmatospirillum siberiense TaxID=382514 RepID=A0A2N3PWD3_9PROT|nr:MFS transporter [Telmatospirillum siberiense]PKU24707.1 MFS transporter [Telmatospirillum siberiense]
MSERFFKRSTVVALIVAGAFFMEYIDSTVIATALPMMARTFHANPVALSIGLTAYLLTLVVFIPVSSWIADRFGTRSVFTSAMTVFTLASVLCGLSEGVGEFVAARVLQGIGGAMMVPVGRMVVLRTTEKKDLISAIALLTWPALAAPILGPPLGGLICTYWSWRWIFLLNVPLGLAGILAALKLMPNIRAEERRPFDPLGFLMTGSALACVMYGVDRIGNVGSIWSLPTFLLMAGVVLGMASVRHLRRHPTPVIDLWPMRVPTFAATTWGGSLFRMTISSAPFLMPLMLQVGFGMSALTSGGLTLWIFIGNFGMKAVTTPILKRFGFRTTLVVNGAATAISILACSFLFPSTPTWILAAVLCFGGLCRSMQFTAISSLSYADIPPDRMSGASSFGSLIQQMSLGMGVAAGALALHIAMAFHGHAGEPLTADFQLAFALLAVVAALGLISFLRLDPSAGADVSGHRPEERRGRQPTGAG